MKKKIKISIEKLQVVLLFIFSIIIAIIAIIHGIFFDLNISEIGRLTIGGLIATLLVLFPVLLLLEWVFDINNNNNRLAKIEKALSKLRKINK